MLKRQLLLITFILFLKLLGFGQTSFEFLIDTEEDSKFWNAASDEKGNIILAGNIGSYIGFDFDALVMKISPTGEYISHRFDRQDTVSGFDCVEILDNGNYILMGSHSTDGLGYLERKYVWVCILDTNLNLISEKSFDIKDGYQGFGTPGKSIVDNAGNIIFASKPLIMDKEKNLFVDFGFYKFNQEGDTLLSKYYHFIWDELPFDWLKVPESNELILLERATTYNNSEEIMLLDTDFNILNVNKIGEWNEHYGGNLSSDCWIDNSTFLMSARGDIDMGGYTEFYIGVYSVDTSGQCTEELVLNKADTVDYPAWVNSMAYANDTTIYVGGFQTLMGLWSTEPTIIELYVIDKYANLLGYKELGGNMDNSIRGIIATKDNGCLLYGESRTNEEVAERDVHIWKVLREDIELLVSVKDSPTLETDIKVFPNPVHDKLQIDLGKNQTWDKMQLSIANLEGKTVFQKKINESGNLLEADLSNLQSGIYIIQISKENQIIYLEKIIKQ